MKELGGWTIVFFVLLISGWDLFLDLYYGPDSTISRYMRRLNQRWLMLSYLVAFAMGGLFGHFFLCPACP